MFLLDTNILGHAIRGTKPTVRLHIHATPRADLFVSAISQAELLAGAHLGPDPKLPGLVDQLLATMTVLSWNAAEAFAKLSLYSRKTGKNLGSIDMLIAAHAVSLGAVLVTNDKAFQHFHPALKLADWTR